MTILLTGASGFLGRSILAKGQERGLKIRPVFRCKTTIKNFCRIQEPPALVPTLDGESYWGEALSDIDVVIHCAARVHLLKDPATDPLVEFRKVNVQGTLNLARQAAKCGARRFIFISSIKVNGECTNPGEAFTPEDDPAPQDPYGLSKAEAEAELRGLATETGMEVTIIRPPLVYGRGSKGNFCRLLHWVYVGLPLPLASVVDNRRSFVCVDNLVDLIFTCVNHPNAANQTFLVSDGEDLSTSELLRRIAAALNRHAFIFPMPVYFLVLLAKIMGGDEFAKRLFGSLQVDIDKTRALLNWSPILSVSEGLRRSVENIH